MRAQMQYMFQWAWQQTYPSGLLGSEVPELPGSCPVSSVKLKCPGQTAVSALSGGSIGAFAKVATEVCWGHYFRLFSSWATHLKSIGDSLRSLIYFNKLLSCTLKLRWILLFKTMTHFQRLLIMEGAFPLRYLILSLRNDHRAIPLEHSTSYPSGTQTMHE